MPTPAVCARGAPTRRGASAANSNSKSDNNYYNTHLCCQVEQEEDKVEQQQQQQQQQQEHQRLHDNHNAEQFPNVRRSRAALVSSLCLLALITALLPSVSHGYNIDLPSYVRHRHSPTNTMFGFSIALHKASSGYARQNSLVVGAPKHDTSAYQQNVREAGAVFRCGMEDDKCRLVEFDSSGDHRNTKGEIIERKSYQWLGATVSTGRDNDLVVACAPRYIFHTMTPSKSLRYDPVGTCFTTRNFTQFNEVSPCRTNNWGYHRQGSCQAGFSAAINSNGSRLFIGAPGSWYWQGQTYSISPVATFPYKPPYYQPFGTGGQTFSHDVTRPENQVFSTAESSSLDDDSYLGYSMVTGDFDGDRSEDVAIGMPRGAGLLGKIVVNRWNMANIFNVTGRQIGEYFGYSLAASDVDGDGYDDLIIGAPMYTEPDNVEGKYDVGRVYILLQYELKEQNDNSARQTWKTEFARDGFNSKGRFGLAVTTLGDVNRDGYGDFAVGAPYDGPEGRGVVYIYHGSARGPLAKPSQIIKSEDLVEGAPYPRTFGFALSGGVDMDSNTYPDLAVGAYASDQVFIFKSRPVAAVDATVRFSEASKLINLEKQTCSLLNNKPVACMGLETCLKYNGEFLPRDLNFRLSWVLDSRKSKNPRMFFLLDEGQNVRNLPVKLHYNSTFCHVETVYVVDNVQDKLTPLEVELRYDLDNYGAAGYQPVVRRRREALQPIIDKNREIVIHDAINIQKNCGKDNICEPDLKLEIKTVDKYLFGSPEPLTIDVLISNNNEDAFEAAFYMIMPRDLDLKKVQQEVTPPITCTNPTEANNYTLKCDIGNPLPGKKIVNFQVIMTPSEKFSKSPSYDFYMEANSTNPEVPQSHFDNVLTKSIGIWVDSDLAIEGTSFPDFQLYKASDYKSLENATNEEDLGPQVVHFYNIRNNRPSTIEEAVVFLHYPYETIAGDTLMYMTNQPETAGNIRCDLHTAVNSRKLKLDMNLVQKSYLQQIGAVVRGTGQSGASAGGVLIEKSYNNQGGVSTGVNLGTSTKVWTAKEKEILEKDDAQDVSGDASFIHSARANDAAAAVEAGSGSGSGSGSNWSTWSTSWNSSSNSNEPTYVVSSKNSSTYYDANGQRHVVESSTEYVHHLDGAPNAQYSQQQQLQRQFGIANAPTGLGAHSTHGHVQMAGSPGGAVTYQQTHSSGAYRPQQPQQQQHQYAGSYGGANDKTLYGGQSGFQANVLDLNAIHRDNVDNDLRSYGSPQQPQGGSYNYRQSYSSRGQPATITHQQIAYPGGSQKFYGIENENHYDDLNSGGHQQQQWASTGHRRVRREEQPEEAPKQIDLNSPCKAAKCQTVRCVVSNLINDDGAWVAMRMRMVAKTMEKLASNVPLNVSTLAVAHVTRLPFIGEPKDPIIKSHEIFYKAEPEPTPVPDVVPLWVVVLAACAGALILLLLIFLLYKCGFFNRNRPRDHSMERQPLRNGYHGDEHL